MTETWGVGENWRNSFQVNVEKVPEASARIRWINEYQPLGHHHSV
jgi:hypothetical protein